MGNNVLTAPVVSVEASFAPDTNAYTAADAFGGELTWTVPAMGVIQTMVVTDTENNQAAFDLVLFDNNPTATADNAAFDPTDADLANILGIISISAGNYGSFNDNGAGMRSGIALAYGLDRAGLTSGSEYGTLYGQCVIRAAETYSAAQTITIRLAIIAG